jgi:hypothetical protein
MRPFHRMHARVVVAASVLSLAACPKKKEAVEDIVKPSDTSSAASSAASSSASSTASEVASSPTSIPSITPLSFLDAKPVLDALGNCTVGGSSSSLGVGGFGNLGGYGGIGSPGTGSSSSSGGGEGIGLGSIGTIGHGSGTGSGGPGMGFGSSGPPPVIAGTILDVSGALAAPAVGKIFCDGMNAFHACFSAASPTAATLRANATYDITLGGGGELSKYAITVASGDSTLDACLLVAIQSLPYPKSSGETHFGYALIYARRPKTLKMISPEPDVKGKLPSVIVKRIVRANFPRLRACYEAYLAKSPGATGALSVKFEIDATGAVTSASPGSGTLTDPALLACTVAVFKALSFPEPESGTVDVTFPIKFAFD